jgi:hypothetical protein
MKNILAFDKRTDCLDFIFSELITNYEFHNNNFYRGLIDWIVDNRAPIFYEANLEYEYSHFTQYFNFILIRHNYENSYLQSMYYLHDFMHMIFNNPIPPNKYSLEKFTKIAIENEFYASNETEILIYYRIPELREKTIDVEILYDLLIKEGFEPDINKLFKLRNKLVYGNLNESEHLKFKTVLPFFRRFTKNNLIWCKLWYYYFPRNIRKHIQKTIPYTCYYKYLDSYRLALTENIYKKSLRCNVQLASALTNLEILSHKDLNFKLKNTILLDSVAKQFHTYYKISKESYLNQQAESF